MSYIEATLIVDGAVDESVTFMDTECVGFNEWFNAIVSDFSHSQDDAQVYIVAHGHESGIECECIQYLTDHKPYWNSKEMFE